MQFGRIWALNFSATHIQLPKGKPTRELPFLRRCQEPNSGSSNIRLMFSCKNIDAKRMGKVAIIWFRNDLRLHDNSLISRASNEIKKGYVDSVLPVFFFDPVSFSVSDFGNQRSGPLRTRFLLESVRNLKENFKRIESDLFIFCCPPQVGLLELASQNSVAVVYAQAEVTHEEIKAEESVRDALPDGVRLELEWGTTLLHREDLPFADGLEDMPDSFTQFRRAVEGSVPVRAELECQPPAPGGLPLPRGPDGLPARAAPPPELQSLPGMGGAGRESDLPATHCEGGEDAALRRLQFYLWDTDYVAGYFDTRNGMLGRDFSTKLSAWLAAGCLSPRRVYWELSRYERERAANKSTYWVLFELLTRDFYKFFAAKHGRRIFAEFGLMGPGLGIKWDPRPELFERWKEGRTGYPLVDANMREIAATGYMSNRGRQNVASFLVMEYGVDWRRGADYFEHALVDYDPALNWGNWVAAAGLTGGRLNRFNVVKQSKEYDAGGDYLRTWLPELSACPADCIHEPWLIPEERQAELGIRIGKDYPLPIPTDELPFARMKQMDALKRLKSAQSQQKGKQGGSRKGSGADRYQYHDRKCNKGPEGTKLAADTKPCPPKPL
uniref:Cryptochrome DASH n=2 Tax=Tetraselmis sp. GSL018 TaxID=582737 RepID=A0A061S6U1_9CHLO